MLAVIRGWRPSIARMVGLSFQTALQSHCHVSTQFNLPRKQPATNGKYNDTVSINPCQVHLTDQKGLNYVYLCIYFSLSVPIVHKQWNQVPGLVAATTWTTLRKWTGTIATYATVTGSKLLVNWNRSMPVTWRCGALKAPATGIRSLIKRNWWMALKHGHASASGNGRMGAVNSIDIVHKRVQETLWCMEVDTCCQ